MSPTSQNRQSRFRDLNTDQSPEQTGNVIRAYINLMSGRVNEINERSQQYFGRDVNGVTPETAIVFALANPLAAGMRLIGQAIVLEIEVSNGGWTPSRCCPNIDTRDESKTGFDRLTKFVPL